MNVDMPQPDLSSHGLSRREFLKGAAVAGGVLLAGGFGYRQLHNHLGRDFRPQRTRDYLESILPAEKPGNLPNFIIILLDDLGYGDLVSPAIAAPNFKRMASEGTRLSSFYASAAVCSPSRAGMLTGRYPVRTLITLPLHSTYDAMNVLLDVLGMYSYNVRGIPGDEALLPEVLQRRGYRTGLVGKWHLGGTPGHLPNDRGFDSFFGALWSNDDPPYALYRDRQVVVPAPANQDVLTHDFTQAALEFILASQDHPFFLYLAHAMPHTPIHASPEFRGRSQAGLYGDAVEELDWSLGLILDSLDQLDLSRNTLVLLSSDNGPWWQGSPGFARGRKLQWFEGSYRVPFIARWPGVIPAGMTSSVMSMNFDLFPTLLNLAGAPLPQDRIIDGKDLLPVLKGEAASLHDALFFYNTRTLVGVRQEQWKYYRRYITDNSAFWPLRQGPFLFDLGIDPNESYSLVESQPERASALAARLEAFDAEIKSNLRGWL
ncbi:MAG: hypothetical protein A2Z16_04760 [Chloroflexi bacterium RBG_16_54_18]|nr:MAG: hypothetical protein A2Z16_04760 [Chloroflexi bacterium RBG_16_54_18]